MDIERIVLDAVSKYQRHLKQRGAQRQELHLERGPYMNLTWPSALGWCPLAGALKKHKSNPIIPQDEVAKQFRFAMGNRVAEYIQEAMVFAYGKHAIPEKQVMSRELGLGGYIDVLLQSEANTIPIEIKTTTRSQPYFSQLIQVYAYMLILDTQFGAIVLLDPLSIQDNIHVWTVERSGERTIVYSNEGDWQPYHSDDELTPDTVAKLVDVLQTTLAEIDELPKDITYVDLEPYIPFPDSDPRVRMCHEVLKKPVRYKRARTVDGVKIPAGGVRPGIAIPRCEYYCRGPVLDQIKLGLDEEDNIIVLEDES